MNNLKSDNSIDFEKSNLISESHIELEVCDEVKDKLKDSRIIEIVGDIKTGKTTLACNIAKLKGRETIVLSPHQPDCDIELYNSNGVEVVEAKKRYRDRLSKLKGGTVIFDDAQALSRYQKDCLNGMLLNLRKEKQDLHIIIVYHYGSAIHDNVLRNNVSFLIVKRNSNISVRKLGVYITANRRSSAVKTVCDNLTEFQSLYIFKDAYATIDFNEIYEILPKEKELRQDYKDIVNDLREGLSVISIADKYNCSRTTIYSYLKREKANDQSFAHIRKVKKHIRVIDSASERGYRKDGKFIVEWQTDTLKLGKSTGYKRDNVELFKKREDIGDFATVTIADIIINNLRKRFDEKPIGYYHIMVDTSSKGGYDISINTPSKSVEIEVKNWTVNPSRNHIYPSDIKGTEYKKGIKDKFSDNSEKWLITCGLGCSRTAKVFLDMYGIGYVRLTNKQLKNLTPVQRCRMKKRIDRWLDDVI